MELPSRNSESNYIKQLARYMYKRPKMTQTKEYKSSDTKNLVRPTCPELQFAKEEKERKMGMVGTSSKVGGRERRKRREGGIAC
jgi:hypothetical protein